MLIDIILFLTGIIVGVINAVAGGGGLIGFPVILAVGLKALTADATNYVAILPGQVAAALGYREYIRKVPKIYLLLVIPCVAGAAVGAHLLRSTSIENFEKLIPFLVLTAVATFALQPVLHFHLLKHMRSRNKSIGKFIAIGLVTFLLTIYGGYFGVGMGFAILALLGTTRLQEIHTLNGLKNLAGVIVVVVAIISIFTAHLINWHYGLVMGAGNLIGGYAGARIAQKFNPRFTRIAIIIYGAITVGYLLWRYH